VKNTPPSGVEEHAAGLLLAAVALLVAAQLVLARLAPRLASPITPIVLGLFFWATLLGIPAATRRGAHLGLGVLSRLLPTRWTRALRAIGTAASLLFLAVLAVTGARLCWGLARGQNRSLVTWCPDWVVALCVPLAGALGCLRAVQWWLANRRDWAGEGDGEGNATRAAQGAARGGPAEPPPRDERPGG